MTKTDLEEGRDAYSNKDYETALKKLEPLASNGNSDAQYYMGRLCSESKDISHDYSPSIKWYTRAAEQGHVEAQFSLAGMHMTALIIAQQGFTEKQGVPKDIALVCMWYKIAAFNGHEISTQLINKVKKKMNRDQIAKAERLTQEWLAKHHN